MELTTRKTCSAPKSAFDYLCDHCYGSSGYGGNLAGMRKLYWGKDAYVVRCRGYLFRVSYNTFARYNLR